jgi:hypothetical protein
VSVLPGNGDGTFRTAIDYAVGSRPQALAFGDFNGDGKLDLATANNTGSSASVLMGTGDGTFGPATTYGLARVGQNNQLNQAVGITAADLNGDGALDFAVCTEQSSSSVLSSTTVACPDPATEPGPRPEVSATRPTSHRARPWVPGR